jgi:hypothetical protein
MLERAEPQHVAVTKPRGLDEALPVEVEPLRLPKSTSQYSCSPWTWMIACRRETR